MDYTVEQLMASYQENQPTVEELKDKCKDTEALSLPTKELVKLQVGESMKQGYEAQGMTDKEAEQKVDEECEKLANTDNPLKSQLEQEKDELNCMITEFEDSIEDLDPVTVTADLTTAGATTPPNPKIPATILKNFQALARKLKKMLAVILGKISFLKVAGFISNKFYQLFSLGLSVINGILKIPAF